MLIFRSGDATQPHSNGCILHICNSVGKWGAGFVMALSNRWKEPENEYRKWYHDGTYPGSGEFKLGNIQQVLIPNTKLSVCNMIAQFNIKSSSNPSPIRYDALRSCLIKVDEKIPNIDLHAPRFGCGLAGGNWDKIQTIVLSTIGHRNLFIYDL